MPSLTSAKNPLLKQIRKAVSQGTLTDSGLCVAEGPHLLEEALRSGCEVEAVLVTGQSTKLLGEVGENIYVLPEPVFASISSTETTQGVITLVRPPAWDLQDIFSLRGVLLGLDGIQDPGNAGTMIRSAEAFGAAGVIFLKGSVNPYNPKCVRASAGSLFRIPIAATRGTGAIPGGRTVYALNARATTTISECDFTGDCMLMVGNEAHGVGAEVAENSIPVRIPTTGVESLNAAIAAAVALYEAQRQRRPEP